MYPLSPVSATESLPPVVLLYRFGPYEADTARSELRKFGIRIRLERKPWQLLIALLDHAGEVATRSELQHSLWGEDVFVDFDTGLNVAVKKLRGALCDSIDGSAYIETVAGEGYCFVAAVEKVFATTANGSVSTPPEPIPASPLPPIPVVSSLQAPGPEVPFTPAIQAELNYVSEEASTVAEGRVLRLEQEVHHPRPGGSLRQSWSQTRKAGTVVAVVVCVVLIMITVVRLAGRLRQQPARVHGGKIMVAVLPFVNLSGDPSQEYLSDGIEELSARLGNLNPEKLGVIGRTSAMTYKHSSRTISQIGRELAVGYILEGSVRREGSKLRVTAQLVEVSDQAHVWAQNYDRNVRDLLQVEYDVASDIAQRVGVSVALGPPTESSHPHIPNPEAHEAYLLARYYWNKRTPAGIEHQYPAELFFPPLPPSLASGVGINSGVKLQKEDVRLSGKITQEDHTISAHQPCDQQSPQGTSERVQESGHIPPFQFCNGLK